MSTFIKAIRSETASFLDFNPNANHLLNVISRRARRTECKLNDLSIGECFISFKSVGLTEQQYRTAKKHLQKIELVSFRVARKLTGGVTSGVTVAKLMDSRVYDINIDDGNATVTPTQRQPNANLTSNKNEKNEKNENNIHQQIADSWNEVFKDELPSVSKVTQKRKSAINGCIAEMKGTGNDFSILQTWTDLFVYAKGLDFLMGRKTDWSMSFDFITTKSKLIKLVEGEYDNK
tara:strand:+ start:17590 stop:18291 length:702 start_codon:yes stop_codon:yes gene_type:complete